MLRFWAAFTALLLLSVALIARTQPRAEGAIDLTGSWNVQFPGYFGFSCPNMQITQTGSDLTLVAPCFPGPVAGTLNKGSGDLSAGACFPPIPLTVPINCITMTGSASQNEIAGSYKIGILPPNVISIPGTFHGYRKGFEPPTPTPPEPEPVSPPVGGISIDPPTDGRTPSGNAATPFVLAGAGLIALAGWFARRRWARAERR